MARVNTADGYRVLNAYSSKPIPRVIWADPDTGEYAVERDVPVEERIAHVVASVIAASYGRQPPAPLELLETRRGAIRVVRVHGAPKTEIRRVR